MSLLNSNYLLASLFWDSVGVAYFVYGKRQQSLVPLIGGLVMIGVTFFVNTALLMSLFCVGLMLAVYVLLKQGY
jgi:hypothetical protein